MKPNKWDLIKFISFYIAKKDRNKMKRLQTEKKIFANNATNKSLTSKIYKHLIKLNNNKTTQLENGQKT